MKTYSVLFDTCPWVQVEAISKDAAQEIAFDFLKDELGETPEAGYCTSIREVFCNDLQLPY